MSVGFIRNKKDNPSSGNTSHQLPQRNTKSLHQQGSWWAPLLEVAKVIVFIDYLQKCRIINGKKSYERLSKPNGQEIWRKGSCFVRATPHDSSPWFQWLLCITVAWKLLDSLQILLIRSHLTMLCSPTWKILLAGNQCRSDGDVIPALHNFLGQQDKSFFAIWIQIYNTDSSWCITSVSHIRWKCLG